MWEENENKNINSLGFNKGYAQKFEQRKKRETLDKARREYGKDLNSILDSDNGSESSSSAPEDERAELLNDTLSSKFIKTLAKIREKDPEIYKKEKNFFNDKDFEEKQKGKREKNTPFTYKDLVRRDLVEGKQTKKTALDARLEEQDELKKAFKLAADGENEGDDLFKVKRKTKKEIEDENTEFNRFLQEETKKSKPEDIDMLQRFWGDEAQLDDTDKFLRKYILTKGWIDQDAEQYGIDEQADEEDERRDSEMEDFEEKYNFRYEEEGADQVMTYAREHPDSVRQKTDTRKEKRKEKDEKKKELVVQQQEEVKQLKKIMKQDILDRIKRIQDTSGSNIANQTKFNSILDKDFDPNDYDKLMNQEFGEDYYNEEDEQEDEIQEYIKQQEEEYNKVDVNNEEEKVNEESPNKKAKTPAETDKENLLQPKTSIPIYNRVGIKEAEAKEIANTIGDLWWYCDTCLKGIKEGEGRFECLECQDFCQCKKCADMKEHPHKMKKFIVPQGCAPPSDKEITRILDQVKFCAECNYKFTEYDHICELKQNKEFLLCEDCMKNNERQYKEKDFNMIKPSKVDPENMVKGDIGKLKSMYDDEELNKMIDGYYQLDFEDVISGGFKTRFKYLNVEKNSYGLTDNELLFADDKVLNQFVSIKKLNPYRFDNGNVNMKTRRKTKHEVKRDAERNEKGVFKDMSQLERKEETLKKQGASKEEINQMRKYRNELRVNIANKAKRNKVKLLKEEDVERMDFENEQAEAEEQEVDEPQKEKKRKLNSSRLKSYGLE